jgi:cobalamin biosynthesis protein CobD/CbiB
MHGKEDKMAEENKEGAKGAFIEKLLFALLPLLIGSTGYLISALGQLQHDVTVLNAKVSLVVTSDNRQASNTSAELAREKLRQDLTEAVQRNRDAIQENRLHIAILEEKVSVNKKIKPLETAPSK